MADNTNIDNIRERDLTPEEYAKALKVVDFEEWKNDLPSKDYKVLPRKTNKVAIVGFAPTWKDAPFGDESWEIWGINDLYKYLQRIPNGRANRWFEIHSRYSPSKNKPDHIGWLQKAPIPIYMWEHYDDIPGSFPYPYREIVKWLEEKGSNGSRYFTNQISWMMALAWYEGFEEIGVYGVNMATDSEYGHQRPSCEYLIGKMEQAGVRVTLPAECDLLKPPGGHLYGFETDNKARLTNKARINDVKKRNGPLYKQLLGVHSQLEKTEKRLSFLDGQISVFENFLHGVNMDETLKTNVTNQMKSLQGEYSRVEMSVIELKEKERNIDVQMGDVRGAIGAYEDVLKHIL
jgi:hypothetical protein